MIEIYIYMLYYYMEILLYKIVKIYIFQSSLQLPLM